MRLSDYQVPITIGSQWPWETVLQLEFKGRHFALIKSKYRLSDEECYIIEIDEGFGGRLMWKNSRFIKVYTYMNYRDMMESAMDFLNQTCEFNAIII